MNTNKLKLLLGIFVLSLVLPNQSLAYFTTNQTSTKLNEETVLYTISYKFGFESRELYMPIVSLRDAAETASNRLGYSIMSDDNSVFSAGQSHSLVLTNDEDVQIKDGQYYLPVGKSAEFTLVTILNVPPAEQSQEDLSVLVTSLPFTMVDDGEEIQAQLNPSELQYYVTPAVEI